MTTPSVLRITDDTGRSTTDFVTFDNVVDIEGSAAPNAAVQVIVTDLAAGSDRVFNVTANALGEWVVPQVQLPDGNTNVLAQVPDGLGGFLLSLDQQILVDPNAPLAPRVIAINDDTGISPDDAITSDGTLIFEGSAHPDSIVTVFLDGTSLGTAFPSELGAWDFNLTGRDLAEGVYSLDLVAQSVAGVSTNSAQTFTFVVDKTPPAPPMILGISDDTGTLPNDGVTTDQTLIFNGTADPNAPVGVFLDGVAIGGTQADAQGNWSYDHTGTVIPVGQYSVTAQSIDLAGNMAASTAFPIDIQPTTSVTPTVEAITTDTGRNSTDGITADQTLVLSGTSAPNATVEVAINGTAIGQATANASGVWNFDNTGTSLAPGGYDVTAVTLGPNGIRSPESQPFTIQIDTAPPATPSAPDLLAVSDSGISDSDNITNTQGVILSTTSEPNAEVTLFSSKDGQLGQGIVPANGVIEFRGVLLTEGVHDITAIAEDAAGNRTGPSLATQITVDRTAPTPAPTVDTVFDLLGIGQTSGFTSDTTPQVSGEDGAGGTVHITSIGPDGTVRDHGTTVATLAGTRWFLEVQETLADGQYRFFAEIADTAGNTTTSSPFNVTIDTVPPQTPTVSFTTDTGQSQFDGITSDETPTFFGTAAPGETITLTAAFSTSSGGGGFLIGSATADAVGNWSSFATPQGTFSSDNTYQISAIATDAAQNTATATVQYVLDTTAPVAFDLSLSEKTDTGAKDNRTSNTKPTFLLLADDTFDSLSWDLPAGLFMTFGGFTTHESSGGRVPVGQIEYQYDLSAGTISKPLPLSQDVTHDIKATLSDLAGNTTERTVSFAFNQPPLVSNLSNTSVVENSPAGTVIGTFTLDDPTGVTDITGFELTDDAGGLFSLNTLSQGSVQLIVATGATLDFEAAQSHQIEVTLEDSIGSESIFVFTINVTDVVENFDGSEQGDVLVGDAGPNIIDAGLGDDIVTGGGGGDPITLGDGFDIVRDLAANYDGDDFADFSEEDLMVFLDLLVDRSQFTFGPDGQVLVDLDGDMTPDIEFRLRGDFSTGDFMVVRQNGDSLMSFETFLPMLAEGSEVQQSDINGINNQAFLTGDGTTGFRVTLDGALAGAAFDNTLGVYEVDAAGNIIDVRLLFDSLKDAPNGITDITGVKNGHQLGFFLAQDGAAWAKSLAAGDVLEFIDRSEGDTATTDDGGDLALTVNGAIQDLTTFHSLDPSLNPDGVSHVLTGVSAGGQSIVIGFEDLLNAGDSDYQDVVFTVELV